MKSTAFVGRFFCLLLFACASAESVRADEHATFPVGGFTFARPAKWEWVETSSPMRKAQMKITDAGGKNTADVVFYEFGPNGAGGVKANVDRWLGQFTEPREQINAKVEEVTVGKTKITYVHAEGTYKSGMPGGPQTPMTDFALEGAIIETGQGNVFVKLTGPKALVKASAAEFRTLVESGPKKS